MRPALFHSEHLVSGSVCLSRTILISYIHVPMLYFTCFFENIYSCTFIFTCWNMLCIHLISSIHTLMDTINTKVPELMPLLFYNIFVKNGWVIVILYGMSSYCFVVYVNVYHVFFVLDPCKAIVVLTNVPTCRWSVSQSVYYCTVWAMWLFYVRPIFFSPWNVLSVKAFFVCTIFV